MRAHIVKNNLIVNTVEVGGLWPGMLDANEVGGGIGDTWDGAQVIPRVKSADEQTAEAEAEQITQVASVPLVRAFLRMTPAEVDAYIDGNGTNLAEMRVLLKMMGKILLVLARREFR